jgi:Domain of unknown function (DUF4136)
MTRNLIVAMVTLTLTACGTMLSARVSSFHNLPAQPTGLTFAVIPHQWQKGSLEFQTYARAITAELQSKGFVAVPLDQAQYVVFLAYAIDAGREVRYSYPIYGETGVSSSYTSGTVQTYGNTGSYSGITTYNPSYGVVGVGQGSRTEYTRVVRLDILDKSAFAAGQIRKVYEGEVVSAGNTGQLSAVMPTLLKALFTDFPGKSGQSKTVTLPVQ